MRPVWGDEFEFDDVRDDSKLALDVWNIRQGGASEDEFFGKIWLTISDAIRRPMASWHELVPGRLQVVLTWTPYQGDALGDPIPLTLPPTSAHEDAPTGSAAPIRKPLAPEQPKLNMKATQQAALAAVAAKADEMELEEELEDDELDVEELPLVQDRQPQRPRLKIEYHEYTHRGGAGNGPKENQDAYFVKKIDDANFLFGVFDGHGQDNGKLASHVASDTTRVFLTENFARLRQHPQAVMTECFEKCNKAIFAAIQAKPDTFLRDGTLVMEVDEEEWELGYDAVDGGTTASVAAIIDGRTLVYASAGDSCGVFAKPTKGGELAVEELVPEHSPTYIKDWEQRLHNTGALVVYDHPDMFEGPENLLHVFCRDGKGGWKLDEESLRRADSAGCGYKTERGDRAAVIMTPEEGKFSQMMLGVTRSLGDFYHQQYGVTWEPEVVVHDLKEYLGDAPLGVMCIASDGVWDHWTFDQAMEELRPQPGADGLQPPGSAMVHDFFENTRIKGEEAFGNSADNLTGVVVCIPNPAV